MILKMLQVILGKVQVQKQLVSYELHQGKQSLHN